MTRKVLALRVQYALVRVLLLEEELCSRASRVSYALGVPLTDALPA